MAKAPTGVTVISILYILSGVAAIGLGLLLVLGMAFMGAAFSSSPELQEFGAAIGIFLAIIGVVAIVFGALYITLAIFLLKLKNWARITVLALTSIGILFYSLSLIGTAITIVSEPIVGAVMLVIDVIVLSISGFIIWYLGFNKEVKDAFSPKPQITTEDNADQDTKPPLSDPKKEQA